MADIYLDSGPHKSAPNGWTFDVDDPQERENVHGWMYERTDKVTAGNLPIYVCIGRSEYAKPKVVKKRHSNLKSGVDND